MNRLKGTVEKLGKMSAVQLQKGIGNKTYETSGKDKYRKFHKSGPELLITRILMVNGPLTSKQIWRIYERELFDNKQKGLGEEMEHWNSLTKMKQTIKFMRLNEKIASNGYSYKEHVFRGWKIQQKRALKYVHPQVIQEIQHQISRRDNL